jgi:hypothetical protein
VAATDREYSEIEVRGNHKKPPHLLVVGAGNFFDLDMARHKQEAKRGAQWRLQSPIGEEIVYCNRHDMCFSKTPPGLTGKTSTNG